MKPLDVIRRSGRNLRQAKIRTLLTACALAVGGFTLTLTLAAANGARAYSQKVIDANFDPQALIVAKDKAVFGDSQSDQQGPQEYSAGSTTNAASVKLLSDQDIQSIAKVPHVEQVSRQYNLSALYIARPDNAKRLTGAINILSPAQKLKLSAGSLSGGQGTIGKGQVVLPDSYLSPLGFNSPTSAIGQQLVLQVVGPGFGAQRPSQAFTFTIAGVSTKSDLDISFTNVGPFIGEEDGQTINLYANGKEAAERGVPTVIIKGDGTDTALIKADLEQAGYQARTSADLQSLLDQVIQVIQVIILVFGSITLVASFFGVVNTQYISVLERTREIGLMKALGMRRATVSWLFIIEATWIGFIGAVLGSAAAIATGIALNPWISQKINFGDERLLIFQPSQIVLLIVFLMFVTTIAGLLPARKAAKLDPIAALRTE